ncbi:MAG: DUF3078 domain-containing protein [Rickettsiales bacterium]|jgi:hypothetical protein|nr:DUF3078 domain-containing protein [Rickettsiales bacterium]
MKTYTKIFLLNQLVLFGLIGKAFAAETPATDPTLVFNLRRIGFDANFQHTYQRREYATSPFTYLNSNSQRNVHGIFDAALERKDDWTEWNTSLFMEYGETKIYHLDTPTTKTKSADKILLSSDYGYKAWNWLAPDIWFGPFANAQYQTQFTDNLRSPKARILRGGAGIKMFEWRAIKSLYVMGVYEYDFTWGAHSQTQNAAAEFGWRFQYDLNENVHLNSDGYYRHYLTNDDVIGTGLSDDFLATLRVDADIWRGFKLGPFVKYQRALMHSADKWGGNLTFGLSFVYGERFNLF